MGNDKWWVFEIHTPDKMYTIEASYFTASKMGVLFFNNQGEGIGFVPSSSLDLLRIAKPEKLDVSKLFTPFDDEKYSFDPNKKF